MFRKSNNNVVENSSSCSCHSIHDGTNFSVISS